MHKRRASGDHSADERGAKKPRLGTASDVGRARAMQPPSNKAKAKAAGGANAGRAKAGSDGLMFGVMGAGNEAQAIRALMLKQQKQPASQEQQQQKFKQQKTEAQPARSARKPAPAVHTRAKPATAAAAPSPHQPGASEQSGASSGASSGAGKSGASKNGASTTSKSKAASAREAAMAIEKAGLEAIAALRAQPGAADVAAAARAKATANLCTVLIQGLPRDVTQEKVRKFAARIGRVEAVHLQLTNSEPVVCNGNAWVRYRAPGSVALAVSQLSGQRLLAKEKPVKVIPRIKAAEAARLAVTHTIDRDARDSASPEPPGAAEALARVKAALHDASAKQGAAAPASSERHDEAAGEAEEANSASAAAAKRVRDVRESRTVFVGNLPFSLTQDELAQRLRGWCRKQQPVEIRLVRNADSRFAGCAHVEFDTSEGAAQLLGGRVFVLGGRDLRCVPAMEHRRRGEAARR